MKTPLLFFALALALFGCSAVKSAAVKQLVPHYQVHLDSDAKLTGRVGRDLIAVQANGAAEVRVAVQEKEGTAPATKWSKKLAPGDGWYQAIEWGASDGGWIELVPVSCELARKTYPALQCPEQPAGLRKPEGKAERAQMYVSER